MEISMYGIVCFLFFLYAARLSGQCDWFNEHCRPGFNCSTRAAKRLAAFIDISKVDVSHVREGK